MRLSTKYKTGEIPHSEHPSPQAMRREWLCLNGEWSLSKVTQAGRLDCGKILVPFSPETLNSGMAEGFSLGADESLIYERSFALPPLDGKRVVLHFGAVDSECDVKINGKGELFHSGGFTPFSFDITELVSEGGNEITVTVVDNAIETEQPRGKQARKRGGIWYTAQSGIWQTVWLELMPQKHIGNIKITPDVHSYSCNITFDYDGKATVTVLDGDRQEGVYETNNGAVTVSGCDKLWSPENPHLYDIVISADSGDEVRSYFGMRSYSIERDESGKKRLFLNGKPYFFNGVLDQGYWSDGMLTYPCDKAVIDELTMLKEMGFNTVRKHIKLEPMRWYYHCDRIGLVVWQDFVNGGGEYKFSHVAALPFLGFHHRDDDYVYFARTDGKAREDFYRLAEETVDALYNCVSVGVWVPFNEGWGQFDSAKMNAFIREKDPTRIIDTVSGWHDQGEGKTEIKSMHTYYTPLKVPRDGRAVVLSEFGGYSMKVDGHVFDEDKEFGYKKFRDGKKLEEAVEKLYLQKLLPLIKKGLSGAIYTQVSDVEEEINGLVTYDRRVQKISTAAMSRINAVLKAEWGKIR